MALAGGSSPRRADAPKRGAISPSISGTPPPEKLPRSVSPGAGAPAVPAAPAGGSDSASGAGANEGAGWIGGGGVGGRVRDGALGLGVGLGGRNGVTGGGWTVACTRRKRSSWTGRRRV